MHEVIGHGSGKLSPRLTHEAGFYLKEYFPQWKKRGPI